MDTRLYLHIGRNKAGSTSLQSHWMKRASDLRQAGVQYALFGQPSPPGSGIPTFPSHLHLMDFVGKCDAPAVLVSNEIICCFPDYLNRGMAADLANLDLQVLFYVRPYRAWVFSSYRFDVRTGRSGLDFDRYLESIRPLVSFPPMLEVWGETIGWDRIRVRSLDPRDLQGGDLITDADTAIGVTPPFGGQPERDNVSCSWITVELMREAAWRDLVDRRSHPTLAITQVEEVGTIINAWVTAAEDVLGGAFDPPDYLTRAQANSLADLYNRDLEALAVRTGVFLQPDDARSASERAFLPSFAHAPRDLVRLVQERALNAYTESEMAVVARRALLEL